MLDTVEGVSGYTQIHCIWLKSGFNKIQSLMHLMNLGLDTMRYNVSGPSLDTMDTHLASRDTVRPNIGLFSPVRDQTRLLSYLILPEMRVGAELRWALSFGRHGFSIKCFVQMINEIVSERNT